MAKVKERFVSNELNGRLLEAVKNMNIVRDALDDSEAKVISQVDEIVSLIMRIEV